MNDLQVPLPTMESVESVDVSWLHHSQRDYLSRSKSVTSVNSEKSGVEVDPAAVPKRQGSTATKNTTSNTSNASPPPTSPSASAPPSELKKNVQEESSASPVASETKTNETTPQRNGTKPISMRRNSWISNLSSKFSSGSTPPSQSTSKGSQPSPKATSSSPSSKPEPPNPFGAAYSPREKQLEEKKDENAPSMSTSPKGPSFLQNAFRKLSSGSGGLGKSAANGAICERRVMNIDPNRERCKIPDLDQGKLRRVAFCVDVEIAGISRRESDDEETSPPPTARHFIPDPVTSRNKKNSQKSRDKSEATALKSPQSAVAEKEKQEHVENVEKSAAFLPELAPNETNAADGETKEPTRKQEKKKRSEEERRERRERRRRHAVANGTVPLQLNAEEQAEARMNASSTKALPTTDPVRIYRRCCQLRESPALKKIVDQIASPSSTLAESPGTVAVFELRDFPMTTEDISTFCDWLAIVPVRKLILENCGLTDASVRTILSALLSTKTVEQMHGRRGRPSLLKPKSLQSAERMSVVEKLSLKDNPQIGVEGWHHICVFIHLSKSLKAIDLSGIPFPKASTTESGRRPASEEISTIFSKCLADRYGGDRLEELLLSECKATTEEVGKICDAAISIGLRRFGFANNGLTKEGLEHVLRYFKAGKCEGLDLGGNPIQDHMELLASAIEKDHPLYALSLADCSLTPLVLYPLFQGLTRLRNLRFVDFSHNPGLFTTQPDALAIFRRFLPKMASLKRIHLANVNLNADHAIALAEVLPEIPSLCHLNILENPSMSTLASASDHRSQEEACAVYASLMAAVRVSRTIIAVDIEVPSAESNEVVKALASQIVAYSLRNLERGAIAEELTDPSDSVASRSDVPVPEILQHIVGNGSGDEVYDSEDELAPDEDYVIGGTGVVKALGVCLGARDHNASELLAGDQSAPPSGTTTPRHRKSRSLVTKRPRDMSKNLLSSARNIRTRIQSALVREDTAGNDTNYRRLQFLDFTLHRMIQRFEDEYPETRITQQPTVPETSSPNSGDDGSSQLGGAPGSQTQHNGTHGDNETAIDDDDTDNYALRLSRSSSMTSLHARAMTSEEGHVHRLGQGLRRDFLGPSINPADDGDEDGDDEDNLSGFDYSYINALRDKLDRLHEEQEQEEERSSRLADKTFQELGSTVDDLWTTRKQDSEAFEKFRQSQIAAQINSGRRSRPDSANPGGLEQGSS